MRAHIGFGVPFALCATNDEFLYEAGARKAHETLHFISAIDINILGIVFNAGTVIVDVPVVHFHSLMNSGTLRIGAPWGFVLLGDLSGVPNVSTGSIENDNRLITLSPVDNVGDIANRGLWENEDRFENCGTVDVIQASNSRMFETRQNRPLGIEARQVRS